MAAAGPFLLAITLLLMFEFEDGNQNMLARVSHFSHDVIT